MPHPSDTTEIAERRDNHVNEELPFVLAAPRISLKASPGTSRGSFGGKKWWFDRWVHKNDAKAGRHRQKVSNPARNFHKCPGHFDFALKSTGAGGRSRLHQPASLRLRFCLFFGRIPFRYHCSGFRVMMRSTGSILFATRFLWKKYLKHVVEL